MEIYVAKEMKSLWYFCLLLSHLFICLKREEKNYCYYFQMQLKEMEYM